MVERWSGYESNIVYAFSIFCDREHLVNKCLPNSFTLKHSNTLVHAHTIDTRPLFPLLLQPGD